MGTEFLENTRESTRKFLDRKRAELCSRGLFFQNAEELARGYTAERDKKAELNPGDPVVIEAEGSGVVIRRGSQIVGRNSSPSANLKSSLAKSGGFFPGTIRAVATLAPTLEFTLGRQE